METSHSSNRLRALFGFAFLAATAGACSGDSGGPKRGGPDGGGTSGGDSGMPMGDSGMSMEDGGVDSGDGDPDGGDHEACTRAGLSCGIGQRCDDSDADDPRCVDASCEDLNCPEGQDCRPVGDGDGHHCVRLPCDSDVDCAPEEYCDGTTCRLDVCEALTRTCSGDMILACDDVGGGDDVLFSCGSGGYFESQCTTDDNGQAACGCEGDWDCPEHTVCEVGVCVGTGVEPTCTLPAVDFADVPPALELHWGGDDPDDSAHDGTAEANEAPWPDFTHVVSTPTVANLDDDNGDGLINELDFPEILFMAHEGDDPWQNAVVRVIHGGGPDKGADYFARCGDVLWREGEALPDEDACDSGAATADAGSPLAVGDLNGDGLPEIVVPREDDRFEILNHRGERIYTLQTPWDPSEDEGETIAIVNLDHQGYAELVVGPHVFMLGDDEDSGDLIVTHVLTGDESVGINDGASFMACPADLDTTRAGQEIAVGTTLYALPEDFDPSCDAPPCSGSLDVVWHAPDLGGQMGEFGDGADDGYCAVADVWGADFDAAPGPDNPPDGEAEVVLIANGNLVILDGATGTLIQKGGLGGRRGGAPNVDDFDGDGFMEVASALEDYYIVVDLQQPEPTHCPAWDEVLPGDPEGDNDNDPRTPGGADGEGSCDDSSDCNEGAVCGQAGTCVCLHNGWRRGSDDDSSRATSSSVFDFNGDDSAEVVYNDECEMRVYRGLDGAVLYSESSRSRTGIENPVVADVDNDGNAEIVVGSNNAIPGRCDEDGDTPTGVNGVRVFGDPTDTWVSARRIWNQQSYHVTNVTESGGISLHEAESWKVLNGRLYNTYRSQPRSFGVAPDLSVTEINVAAPGGGCLPSFDEFDQGSSTEVEIAFAIRNLGDLRVGPGVVVGLEGVWNDAGVTEPLYANDDDTPLTATLAASLEPTASLIMSVIYDIEHNAQGSLPDQIRVQVDAESAERECNEENNVLTFDLREDDSQVDLRLEISDVEGCPDAEVTATLYNDGSAAVEGTLIHWFAGDPSQGGMRIGETEVQASVPAESSVDVSGEIPSFPARGDVTVYGVVDPLFSVADCARGNNTAKAPQTHSCSVIIL